ncbi:MAG: hypothetical protein HY722_16560 [Planctomycetes bacterium]|nr:hypothetical protein [Planctomycetota bacterium]
MRKDGSRASLVIYGLLMVLVFLAAWFVHRRPSPGGVLARSGDGPVLSLRWSGGLVTPVQQWIGATPRFVLYGDARAVWRDGFGEWRDATLESGAFQDLVDEAEWLARVDPAAIVEAVTTVVVPDAALASVAFPGGEIRVRAPGHLARQSGATLELVRFAALVRRLEEFDRAGASALDPTVVLLRTEREGAPHPLEAQPWSVDEVDLDHALTPREYTGTIATRIARVVRRGGWFSQDGSSYRVDFRPRLPGVPN